MVKKLGQQDKDRDPQVGPLDRGQEEQHLRLNPSGLH